MATVSSWHENDELWLGLLPVLSGQGLLKAAVEEALLAAALLQAQPGAHLLDLGCGPGRHSIELARLGYRVAGVDGTACYLDHPRKRAVAEDLAIEFVQESMLGFRREGGFDAALSLLTYFGYLEDRKDDLRVLENIQASLSPGARVVIDIASKETLACSYTRKHWQVLADRPGYSSRMGEDARDIFAETLRLANAAERADYVAGAWPEHTMLAQAPPPEEGPAA